MIIVLYLLCSIIIMSFFEWFGHRYLMHRRQKGFSKLYFSHTTQHHNRFYKVFNNEPDYVGRNFNIKLDYIFTFIIGAPIFVLLYFLSPVALVCFVSVLIFHHITWNIIHNQFHNPNRASFLFNKIFIFRFLRRYHWMHHKYPGRNYNIVFPIFDYVFKTHQKIRDVDLKKMESIGI